MKHGHWYVTLTRGGEHVEFAFPAAVMGSIEAVEHAERCAPGWKRATVTWRASFAQRQLAGNSQHDYDHPSAPFTSCPPWREAA